MKTMIYCQCNALKGIFVGLALFCSSCNPASIFKKTIEEKPTACYVEISHPLVSLREEPETFSQEIIRISPDTYKVLSSKTHKWSPPFGEKRTERWLKIQANGRTGWIEDNTWTIAEKSSGCR